MTFTSLHSVLDADYCYRGHAFSGVCVSLFVGLFRTQLSSASIAATMEMPLGGAHCLGPKEPCTGWMSTLLLSLPGEYHRSICGAAVMWLVLSLLWPLNTNTNWLAISTTSHIVGCELVKNLKYTKRGWRLAH